MKYSIKPHKYANIPAWADENETMEYLYKVSMCRKEKDYAVLFVLDKLIARIETLETCIDEIVSEVI